MSYQRARTETPGRTHVTEDGFALKCGWGVSRFDADPPEPDWPVCKLCLKSVRADARQGREGAAEFLAELESMPPNDTETRRTGERLCPSEDARENTMLNSLVKRFFTKRLYPLRGYSRDNVWHRLLDILEQNDGLCLDNCEERMILAYKIGSLFDELLEEFR